MRVSDRVSGLPASGIRRFFDLASKTSGVLSLGVGEPEGPTPWAIRDQAIHILRQGLTHYTSNSGLPELREAIAGHLHHRYGVEYDPASQVLATCGVSQGLDLSLRCLLEPGDEVVVIEPAYVAYRPLVRLAGGREAVVPARADNDFHVSADDIADAVTSRTRALVLNYPNNPTGAVLTSGELEEIAQLAVERDLVVISDEIYSRITYECEHTCIAALPGMSERTVLLDGFSKAYSMTGWRLGFLCGPAELVEAALRVNQYAELSAPTVAQHAAVDALQNGESMVVNAVAELDLLRRYACARLDEIGLSCPRPQGAFYAFPDVSATGLSGDEFALRLLREQKVVVIPGSVFGADGVNRVRITYANTHETLQESFNRMERFVGGL